MIKLFLLASMMVAQLSAAGDALSQARPAARGPAPADAPLVTDLSSHLIAITSSFTGTELLLFGAVEEPGDIVVVVRGPVGQAVVRRKQSALGVWLNRETRRFDNVPAYYAVAATKPLAQIAPASVLSRLQIGASNLRFRFIGREQEPDTGPFRRAILRHKAEDGLYREEVGGVAFLGPKLFRTEIGFPATVAVGTYQTEVYLVRDQRIVAAQSTPLFIDKQGVEQELYDFSRREPALYGIIAVLMAVAAGWAAAIAFRRG